MYGVGNLGAQHLLAVLSLLRLLKDPDYVRCSSVLEKTATETKIVDKYRLRYKSINALYNELATEKFNGNHRLVENLGCEFLRD